MHVQSRREKAAKAWRILRMAAKFGLLKNAVEKMEAEEESQALEKAKPTVPTTPGLITKAGTWVKKVAGKCKGAGGKPMPRDSNEKAAWTLIFVFITLIALSALNKFVIAKRTDGEYTIILGSMGALTTLLYSAPNSPLAQPRNVFFGHIVAGAIGALVNEFTVENGETGGVPRWVSQALCPALAIAVLGRLGITHPPAGAVAFITVSSKLMINLGWKVIYLPLAPMALISLAFATLLNNANPKRQYPMLW